MLAVVTDIRQDTPDVKTFRVVGLDGKKPFVHIPVAHVVDDRAKRGQADAAGHKHQVLPREIGVHREAVAVGSPRTGTAMWALSPTTSRSWALTPGKPWSCAARPL